MTKTVLSGAADEIYHLETLFDFHVTFTSSRQKDGQDLQSWYDEFNSIVDVGLALGAAFGAETPQVYSPIAQVLFKQPYAALTPEQQIQVKAETQERFLAIAFFKSCGKQYQPARDHYTHNFKAGSSYHQPPATRQQVLSILTQQWAAPPNAIPSSISSQGTAFSQHGGTNGKDKKKGKRGGNNHNNRSTISHIKYDPTSGMSKINWDKSVCSKCNKVGHPTKYCTPAPLDPTDSNSVLSAQFMQQIATIAKHLEKSAAESDTASQLGYVHTQHDFIL